MIAPTQPKSKSAAANFRKTHEGSRQLSERAHAISSRAGRVLDRLNLHADDQGRCWPSQQTLAAALHVTVRTISYATRELREAGLIDVVTGAGRRHSVYRLRYPAIDRGKSPIENRPAAPSYAAHRAGAPERPSNATQQPRSPAAPQNARPAPAADREDEGDILAAFSDYQRFSQLGTRYGMHRDPFRLMHAYVLARRAQPRHLARYLRAILENHRDGVRTVPYAPNDEDDSYRAGMWAMYRGEWPDRHLGLRDPPKATG